MNAAQEFHDVMIAWIGQIMRLSMQGFMRYAAEAGLSMAQMGVLFRLSRGKSYPVTALGGEMGVTGAAASQMADKLVAMGLVERTEDPTDRRVRRLSLTPRGRAVIEAGMKARQEWISAMTARLSPEEASAIARVIRRCTDLATSLEDARCTAPQEAQSQKPQEKC
ncbi:MAG: MarR family transcriptional regulator [Spirochaetaceae bacterium]|nr:MarR family transcriptional regulator [Spirochaetaceae bacterium]